METVITPTGHAVGPGMVATYCIGSDRYPMVITKVSASGKTIWAERVGHEITDLGRASMKNNESGRNFAVSRGEITLAEPTGYDVRKFMLRSSTAVPSYRPAGGNGSLYIGDAILYLDPSF